MSHGNQQWSIGAVRPTYHLATWTGDTLCLPFQPFRAVEDDGVNESGNSQHPANDGAAPIPITSVVPHKCPGV
jgi:hypothetical protein